MNMTIAQYLKNNNDNTLLLGVISRHTVVKYTEESLIYSLPYNIVCFQFAIDSWKSLLFQ